jgi:hypothetical protein
MIYCMLQISFGTCEFFIRIVLKVFSNIWLASFLYYKVRKSTQQYISIAFNEFGGKW